jgi:hypothetical protein
VGSGERQRMMAKPVLCDTCQGLRCRCCGVLQDWSDSWSPVDEKIKSELVLTANNQLQITKHDRPKSLKTLKELFYPIIN